MYSEDLTKNVMFFSLCLKHQKGNFKIRMLPACTIVHRGVSRPFATVGTSGVDKINQGNHLSLAVSAPNYFQRSCNFLLLKC